MTNNHGWWLKTHSFVITKTLSDYLTKSNVPVEVAECLSFIQNKVIIETKRAQVDERGWVTVHHKLWQNKCSSHYSIYIDHLKAMGELEVDDYYCYLKPGDNPINFIPKCKGYKVPYDELPTL